MGGKGKGKGGRRERERHREREVGRRERGGATGSSYLFRRKMEKKDLGRLAGWKRKKDPVASAEGSGGIGRAFLLKGQSRPVGYFPTQNKSVNGAHKVPVIPALRRWKWEVQKL